MSTVHKRNPFMNPPSTQSPWTLFHLPINKQKPYIVSKILLFDIHYFNYNKLGWGIYSNTFHAKNLGRTNLQSKQNPVNKRVEGSTRRQRRRRNQRWKPWRGEKWRRRWIERDAKRSRHKYQACLVCPSSSLSARSAPSVAAPPPDAPMAGSRSSLLLLLSP